MRKVTRKVTKKHHRKTVKRGGSATNLPAPYFNAPLKQPDAPAGKDLLHSIGDVIRPRIGGAFKRILHKKGGFVPSIMEGFTQMAGKYILPLATMSGYKLLNRTERKMKHTKRRRTRRR